MLISSFRAFPIRIPFRFSYNHHLAKRAATDTVILELVFKNGIRAYGECTPRLYVTGETSPQLIQLIPQLLPTVLAAFDGTMDSLAGTLDRVPSVYPALRCLVESALLYYICQAQACTLFQLFELQKNYTIQYTAPVSSENETTSQVMLSAFASMKMKTVKLKVVADPQKNLARVLLTKKILGAQVAIRMDGNEIWDFDLAKSQIPVLIEAGVSCFEQLFSRQDIKSYQNAYQEWGNEAEFIVDESLTNPETLQTVLESAYIQGANLKISKNGGLLQTLSFAQQLEAAGKTVRLGCHVGECSSLSLAGVVFNGLFDNCLATEGATGTYLLEEDAFAPTIQFGSRGFLEIDDAFKKNTVLQFIGEHLI